MKAAKIIATLGPKVQTLEAIEALAQSGADAFRLNLSYDDAAKHEALIALIREVEGRVGRPLAIVADLNGPRHRIGAFAAGKIALTPGQTLRLDQDEALGDENRAHLPLAEAYQQAKIGDMMRLDDGRVRLRVTAVSGFALTCTVVAGHELAGNKIISLPNTPPRRDTMSDQDLAQLTWAAKSGVDWLSVSWPSNPKVWDKIREAVGGIKLLAKMESLAALNELDQVLEKADGLVIARGDLGYDLPPEDIPGWQKRLVRAARVAGKPVVVAAQMLESMVESPAPTRAEASDVANAVRDGADALMLSAETAVGAYPTEAVEMMASVIITAEADRVILSPIGEDAPSVSTTIAKAAATAADELAAPLIFCFTSSGSTALSVAKMRPATPIVCAADEPDTLRQMQLVWGLNCQAAPALKQWKDVVGTAVDLAKKLDVPKGAPLVITAGMPFGTAGSTNILRIATAE